MHLNIQFLHSLLVFLAFSWPIAALYVAWHTYSDYLLDLETETELLQQGLADGCILSRKDKAMFYLNISLPIWNLIPATLILVCMASDTFVRWVLVVCDHVDKMKALKDMP